MWLIPNAIIIIMNGIVITYWELCIAQDSFSWRSLKKRIQSTDILDYMLHLMTTLVTGDSVQHKLHTVVSSVSFFRRYNVVFSSSNIQAYSAKGDLRMVGHNPR